MMMSGGGRAGGSGLLVVLVLVLWMHGFGGRGRGEASDGRSAFGPSSKGFRPVETFAYWTPRTSVRHIGILKVFFVCGTCGRGS